jgi:hypothetical protein
MDAKKTMVDEIDWQKDARDYYAENGSYRPADIRRLLGHPLRGVDVLPAQVGSASDAQNVIVKTAK